jgi:hypothetical protein
LFEFKPDCEDALKRHEAWWSGAVIDRALTTIEFPRPEPERVPAPESRQADLRSRWLDAGFQAESACAGAANTVYYADALPVRVPGLGPEILAAFCGAPLVFGETTSWSEPILTDLGPESADKVRLDTDGFYFRKVMELIDAYVEISGGRFIVGYPDLHSGADTGAALREPQELCIDMIERPGEVKRLCERLTDDYLTVYEAFHARLSRAGMPSTTWLHGTCRGRFDVASNDFSCMVSDAMFDKTFLPLVARECARMDHTIYHLDGPQALRYLDRLMEVPGLDAIQWVPGAAQHDWRLWVDVYRRIQAREKSFVVYLNAGDVGEFTSLVRPEGAWLHVSGVKGAEEADAVLGVVEQWTGS